MTTEEKDTLCDELVKTLGEGVNKLMTHTCELQDKMAIIVNAFADVQAQIFASIALTNEVADLAAKKAFVTGCSSTIKDATDIMGCEAIDRALEAK